MKVIQNLKNQRKSLKTHYILYIVPVLSFFLTFSNNSAFAESFDASVTIKPSLTLSIPTNTITMNLDPASHDFEEQDLTVKVGTNNINGFKLYVTTPNNNTELVNIADNTKTIPNLTSSYSTTTFPANYWGYRLTEDSTSSSGDYGAFTSSSSTPMLQSNTPINEKIATLGFASKINYLKPSGTYELDLSFKALPIVMQYTMQELGNNSTLASSVCTEEPIVVTDSRDNQTYTIARLKDGNCWMMNNLNLGATTLTTDLTSSNTNLSTTITKETFNSWKKTSGTATYTAGEFIAVSGTDPTSETAYGTLYNYCAASASAVCIGSTTSSTDFSHDLCPAGWRLPTSGPDGEFAALYSITDYHSNAVMRANIASGGLAFTLPGYFIEGVPVNTGNIGRYWSSTWANSTNMYNLYIDTSAVAPKNSDNGGGRRVGFSIRCLLK